MSEVNFNGFSKRIENYTSPLRSDTLKPKQSQDSNTGSSSEDSEVKTQIITEKVISDIGRTYQTTIGCKRKLAELLDASSPPEFKLSSSHEESPNRGFREAYLAIRHKETDSPTSQKIVGLSWKLKQKGIKDGVVLFPENPIESNCIALEGSIYFTKGQIGKGGMSSVYSGTSYSTKPGGTQARPVAIKKGDPSLTKEYQTCQDLGIHHPNINSAENVFTADLKNLYSQIVFGEYALCIGDLYKIEYSSIGNPATYVLKLLKDYANGLSFLHQNGACHRDIKGANLLFDQQERGVIGDLGLVMRMPKVGETHDTALTPHYDAPFIWPNLVCQRTRKNGFQGEAADVYALACVVSRDILNLMICELFQKQKIDFTSFKAGFYPMSLEGPFTDQGLMSYTEKYKGRQIVHSPSFPVEKLLLFRPRGEEYRVTLEAIDKLNGISEIEIGRMQGLAKIAYTYRSNDPEELTIAHLKKDLEDLLPGEEV